jgi:hypothetical protein
MAAYTHPQATVGRAAHSKTLTRLARAGFLGYGLMHVLVAWLAIQIAFGRSSGEGDQTGAFALLAKNVAGQVVLTAVIVGLAAMAIWQLLLAAVGHQDRQGARRIMERIGSAARAVVYAALAFSAGKILAGSGSSSASNQQNATSGALGSGGRALVIIAGIVVFAVGAGLAIYGLTGKFEENLDVGQMSPKTRETSRWLGAVGYVAKGIAYAIVGGLLVIAAVTYNPDRSRGLDAALRTLAGQPYGWLLLSLVAVGFLAFGGYCVVQARYRKT